MWKVEALDHLGLDEEEVNDILDIFFEVRAPPHTPGRPCSPRYHAVPTKAIPQKRRFFVTPRCQELHDSDHRFGGRSLDVLYSDANKKEAYDPELVDRRKRFAHSMKSSSMMLAMRNVSRLAGELESASVEELQVPPPSPTHPFYPVAPVLLLALAGASFLSCAYVRLFTPPCVAGQP